MKKILLGLLLLFSFTILVACGPEVTPPAENQAPVFAGVADVPAHVHGLPFDPAAGVTANDPEDGDLTEDIVITGTVDVNVDAEYTLTYKVSDSEGLETVATRKVTVYTPNRAPVVSVPSSSVVLEVNEDFDATAGVTASDPEDDDLTANIVVKSNFDKTKVGKYQVVYEVQDAAGLKGYATVNVLVVADKDALFNGVLNAKFADADSRHALFAAAERYLLENMVGGVPFYVANSFSLLADRVTLPVDAFIPSYGWGTRYAELTKDYSQVLLGNGQPGNAGEYTYRGWNNQEYTTLNFWTYDDSVSATWLGYIEGGFYNQALNDARNGWEFVPALAEGAPEAYGPTVAVQNGKTTSKTWRISLKEGLEWNYNDAIKALGDFASFDKVLDANDFIWTYREALTRNFFRAISGGGDFVTEIEGAEAYAEAAAEAMEDDAISEAEQTELDALWAAVGLKMVDDHTLEFTTKNAKSTFDAYYLLAWPAMNQDLFEMYGPDAPVAGNKDRYATGPNYVATSGEYIFTLHEAGVVSRFKKNPLFPVDDLGATQWTHEEIYVYNSTDVAFQAFIDGKLETAGIPNARLTEFISDPRLLQTPDATTWRLNINGLQTPAAQQSEFPGSSYIPEPILGYTEMRQALFHILDRQDLQQNWVPSSGIGTTYFSSAYYVEPETGIPYRSTVEGQSVFDNFLGESWGFNKGLALAEFRAAVAKGIADGYYQKGTAQSYNTITLEVRFMTITQSDSTKIRSDFVEQAFEQLVDNVNFIKVEVNIVDTPFPNIYYDHMMTGDFDIAIGGISGSALDAASFLDVFSSDNRGGFTINWGFDSSLPEVPVLYNPTSKTFALPWFIEGDVKVATSDGEGNISYVDPAAGYELVYFSFDALSTALNGKATIVNGDDVPPTLDPGVFADVASLILELEDFKAYVTNVSWPEGSYEIIADDSQLGGIWVVFPDGTTAQQIADALASAGFTLVTYNDGSWSAEFDNGSSYILSPLHDTDTELSVLDVLDAYGATAPRDGEDNLLPAILLY